MLVLNRKHQIKKKSTLRAFTLVEILIYMALFAGFLLILSALFISILDSQLDASTSSHLDQDSWYLMNRLQYDIYRAENISLPTNNGEQTNTLNLETASSNISYSLNNNQLSVTENSQSYVLNSPDIIVNNLNFKKLGNENGNSTITVDLELSDLTNNKTKPLHFTLGLR